MIKTITPKTSIRVNNWIENAAKSSKNGDYFKAYVYEAGAEIMSFLNIFLYASMALAKLGTETSTGNPLKGGKEFSKNISNALKSMAFTTVGLSLLILRTATFGAIKSPGSAVIENKPKITSFKDFDIKDRLYTISQVKNLMVKAIQQLNGTTCVKVDKKSSDTYILIHDNLSLANQWFEEHDGRYNYLFEKLSAHLEAGNKAILGFGCLDHELNKYVNGAKAQSRFAKLLSTYPKQITCLSLETSDFAEMQTGQLPQKLQDHMY